MDLSISKIYLKNFKGYEEVTIHPNPDFNIIIGENNIGKSSLFEAIHLWEKCYTTLIKADKASFYSNKTSRYLNSQDLDFIRIQSHSDLFLDPTNDMCISVTIKHETEDGEVEEYDLGFRLQKPATIENAFLRIYMIDSENFSKFAIDYKNQTGKKDLSDVIFIYQTRPISSVSQYEPYMYPVQVEKKILRGASQEALRNKIILKREMLNDLQASLSGILEVPVLLELPKPQDFKKKEFVEVFVKVGDKPFKELFLQGSGFIQILEILSTIEYINAPLKILLVDEPDSHIHSKLQVNLLKELRNQTSNQFFIISHNDQFVTSSNEGEVFFLNKEDLLLKELNPLNFDAFKRIKEELGGVLIHLELLSAADSIVFTEGGDDQEYIKFIYEKICDLRNRSNNFKKLSFFPLRGKDKIHMKLEYNKRVLGGLFQNKKWIVIYDRDFTTQSNDSTIKGQLGRKLGPGSLVYTHNGYCIESVIFSELDKLVSILNIYYENIDVDLSQFITEWFTLIDNNLRDVSSDIYKELEGSFNGQVKNREDICGTIVFNEIIRYWLQERSVNQNCASRYMTKSLINKFVVDLEGKLEKQKIILADSDNTLEGVCSRFFFAIISSILDENLLFTDFENLFTELSI